MKRALTVIATLLAAGAAALLTAAGGGNGTTAKTYKVVLDNAFGLVKGGDVKVGGVRGGAIKDFELTNDEPVKVAVEVEVSQPGFDSLRSDTKCQVRQQSLIGEYFIDCDLGTDKGKELPDGGTVPVEQTSSTIPPDLVQNVMRRPYRERFRIILTELGVGLAGRPGELNEVIRRAHPGLRETSETFKILARQNKVISDFIEKADTVSRAVHPKRDQLARWAREAEDTASIQASRSEQLGRYWNRLPVFLGELEPTLAQLEKTADRQIPMLRSLQRAAPAMDRFYTALGPFSQASRGSIKALGEASVVGKDALTESKEEIEQLRALAEDAPELAKPLRQFLELIDDRGRSIENDPLAKQTSPPAPDKTAYKDGQGFTGMEALINYVYYQTLGINAFDQVSHVLRIALLNSATCGPYEAAPTDAEIEQCNSWLGPYQPGVKKDNPDPTDESKAATAKRMKEAAGRRARGEPPLPGDPEAPPIPGQIDPSQPRIVLPPAVRDLVDQLPKLPQPTGGARQPAPDTLLDFLLGP
jgi:virulence factor Mce-like protein